MNTAHLDVNAVLAVAKRDRMGFLTQENITALAGHPQGRLVQVLVRCGCCRFICATQDVAFLTEAVVKNGDYVRDVSLPATRA